MAKATTILLDAVDVMGLTELSVLLCDCVFLVCCTCRHSSMEAPPLADCGWADSEDDSDTCCGGGHGRGITMCCTFYQPSIV